MDIARKQTLATACIILGVIGIMAGAICQASSRNGHFHDVMATVSDKHVAESLMPIEAENPAPGKSVIVRYRDINNIEHEATLIIFHGDVPKAGEQIKVSYDMTYPEIAFRRVRVHTPVYMMIIGAMLLVIGGLIRKRLKTAS